MTRLHCAAVLAAVVTGSFGASSDQPWMDASKSPDERVAVSPLLPSPGRDLLSVVPLVLHLDVGLMCCPLVQRISFSLTHSPPQTVHQPPSLVLCPTPAANL